MDMKKMMRQAQRMQMQLNQAQAEVQQMTCEGSAGGGMVKAVVKGDMTLVSIEISPIVVTPDDVDMLQDLVVAAVNDAMRGMNDMAQAHIDAATGGMNLPMM
ncbi:MAG: YbaB/EbfC family nucleoid-associated protein [Coriobacteriia bacterium]|nr:YbaB/EbfC family nucleoid-associated protein [Coriobacteriia bacterium]